MKFKGLAVFALCVWGLFGGWAAGQTAPVRLFSPALLDSASRPTHSPEASIGLQLDAAAFAAVRADRPDHLVVEIPGWDETSVTLVLERFEAWSPSLEIGRTGRDGFRQEPYRPSLLAYRVRSPGASGTLILFDDRATGTFRIRGEQIELAPVRAGLHALFRVADANHGATFSCATEAAGDDIVRRPGVRRPRSSANRDAAGCVEIALDIDAATLATFSGDCTDAVEWALALLAGVDEIFRTDLDDLVTLSASFVHIWETTDPYAAFSNNATGMLESFRTTWLNTPTLAAVERDFVHLLTRRTNTGTGGIAYVGVTCNAYSAAYGVGFSANLDGGTTYPVGLYSWNLNVVAHELGHNFGSNHTHWCGWPGGPIDHCYTYEGSCGSGPPVPQVGTIMSYCHAIAGGSVNLTFHPTCITYALDPTLTAGLSCFEPCVATDTNCIAYGCTDPAACNFDSYAVSNDGSCAYTYDLCGVCGGTNATCDGCMDPAACNYDAAALASDGSCVYAPVGHSCGCSRTVSRTGLTLAPLNGAGVQTTAVGSLLSASISVTWGHANGDTQSWPADLLLVIQDATGSCAQVGGYDASYPGCASSGLSWPASWQTTTPGTYTATLDFSGLGLDGGGTWTVTMFNGWSASQGITLSYTVVLENVCQAYPGCTDPTACNFSPTANLPNGSCVFASGCDFCTGTSVTDGDVDNDGVCDSSDPCVGTLDACGICNGPGAIYACGCTGIPAGDCDCNGNEFDACGVCNGPGAVFACGCSGIPSGDCDCAGNMLDALGVCGGTCAADADSDGVCDNVDPCVGTVDACGVCNGPGAVFACGCSGIPVGKCDCAGNVLDAIGVCGGTCAADADSDGVCDNVDPCVGGLDACGVCNGPGPVFACGCSGIPSGDCDCNGNQLDALGVCGGTCAADVDNDGVCDDVDPCVGGLDACGVCNGPGAVYACGCSGIPAGKCDCAGNTLDALGVCGGTCAADADSDGVCDNVDPCVGTLDACGVCNGPGPVFACGCSGIPAGKCDCAGNTLDALGVCGGSCTADTDNDGVCDNVDPCVGALDACGVCNGPGAIYACGCSGIPVGTCDCAGNTLDALGVCGGTCAADADSDGVCDNVDPCVGTLDACGVCNGPGPVFACGCSGIPAGDCDCNGNQLDALGVCGGACAADADSDGVCDDVDPCVGTLDACGVCNGPGAVFACGCSGIPTGKCDCAGNTVDALGVCGGSCSAEADSDGVCEDVDP